MYMYVYIPYFLDKNVRVLLISAPLELRVVFKGVLYSRACSIQGRVLFGVRVLIKDIR